MADESLERLPVIDGLRGIAILAVIYQHFFCELLASRFVAGYPEAYPWFFRCGWLAVNLFFILSGFVLYRPYAEKIREMQAPDFYKRRFFRLVPLYAFVLVVASLLQNWSGKQRLIEIVRTLSTAHLYSFQDWYPQLNGAYWSIGLELSFSLLFPLLWFASRRSGVQRLFLISALVAFVIRLQGALIPYVSTPLNPVKDCVLARLDDFVLGFVLFEVYAKGSLKIAPAKMFLAGLGLFVLTVHGWDLRANFRLSALMVAGLHNTAQAAFFLISLAALRSQGLLRRIFSFSPLRLAGAMCYSLYLWHGLSMVTLRADWRQQPWDILYILTATAVLAAFTYRYIEFGRVKDARDLFFLNDKK